MSQSPQACYRCGMHHETEREEEACAEQWYRERPQLMSDAEKVLQAVKDFQDGGTR